jgi:hypothetical protein
MKTLKETDLTPTFMSKYGWMLNRTEYDKFRAIIIQNEYKKLIFYNYVITMINQAEIYNIRSFMYENIKRN